MSSRELGPEWVLSEFLANADAWDQDDIGELANVARRLWPRVQVHARKELTNKFRREATGQRRRVQVWLAAAAVLLFAFGGAMVESSEKIGLQVQYRPAFPI